jgi:ABC-type molybdate transport system substrate-binding protein
MAILLADLYKPGLTDLLMKHPGHMGMDKNPSIFANLKEAQYEFMYYSNAKSSGIEYAELPEVMDLSNPAFASTYAKVSFSVDEKNTVRGTPIAHALTIPNTATHKEAAKEFAEMFLAIDKKAAGFLPSEGIIGKDPLR